MYFRNRQEVNDFFGDEIFKFHFRSDGVLTFDTLEPINLGGDYFDFSVTLFDKELTDFFCYSKLSGWLDQFQIFEVIKYKSGNKEDREVLYFEQYKED